MTEDKPISLRSQSVFAPYIKDFVQQKQSLGLKYNAAIETLNMVEAGINLIYIRDFLGHESIETTQVYAKANPEARRKAIEKMESRTASASMPDWNENPDIMSFLHSLR